MASVGSILAYCYLFYSFFLIKKTPQPTTLCIIKNVTGKPCPACGTTRALEKFMTGDFIDGIYLIPLVIFASVLLLIVPLSLIYDFLFKKEVFFKYYTILEHFINKKKVYISLAILLILNWIWNIIKDL